MAPEAIAPMGFMNEDDDEEEGEEGEGDDSHIMDSSHLNNNESTHSPEEKRRKKKMIKLGKASDIWSLGCILYQMLYSRPPFAALSTIQKLTAIPNPNYPIPYPPHEDKDGIEVVHACLQRDPKRRRPINGRDGLLEMRYSLPYRCSDSTSSSVSSGQLVEKEATRLDNCKEKEAVQEEEVVCSSSSSVKSGKCRDGHSEVRL